MKTFILILICTALFASEKIARSIKTDSSKPLHTLFNINNIHGWISYNGQLGHNPYTGGSGIYYPASIATTVYTEGLLWAGWVRDGNNPELRSGSMQYRISTQAGAILPDGTVQNADNEEVRVYRIRRDWRSISNNELTDVAIELYNIKSENITPGILNKIREQYERDWYEWPAELGAPYYDLNGNSIYEPDLGEEPGLAEADQVIWLVVNDLDSILTEKNGGSPPIGLEIQITLWAYKNTIYPFEQTVFQRYRLINKSGSTIDSMYVGKWSDPDIGNYGDEFAGCDTTLNLSFAYNSGAIDNEYITFGIPPPAIGYAHLQGPYVPATGQTALFDFKTIDGCRN
ncbi:MAG: hypothetical protein P8Y99_17635, partial [Calditrichaceae bacterium]